ncbi:LLM class flavin-dependent oxidoreductase, partial [Oxalobacteraceae bacterium]|nr:LLM class flavin-dependent oxidoreductase [Oxalobacteraceae bacterium]
RQPDLSLIFFSSAEGAAGGTYRLLLEAVRFADQAGFKAVWTPERHFQDVGGPYPNPSVLSAAIAAITTNLRVRAGSINLPLHDPLRVAEEWAVVDNLSNGRVDLAIAPGWHGGDFILQPQNYETRREVASTSLDQVQALWRGDAITRTDPVGASVQVRTFPRPVQAELPVWLTISQNTEAWAYAGRRGVNVLTALINHSLEGLVERIAVYRAARAEAGLDPAGGVVSLMLHTYVGADGEDVKEMVRPALSAYLSGFLSQQDHLNSADQRHQDVRALVKADPQAFVDFVFERYYESCSLLGSAERCAAMLRRVAAAGVSEVACLIDFGLEHEQVQQGLRRLAALLPSAAA